MGYSLEFYGLGWSDLRTQLTKPEPEMAQSAYEEHWLELFEGSTAKRSWDQSLQEIAQAIAAQGATGGKPKGLSENAQLVMMAMIRSLGDYLGSLDHASASGEAFRNQFLEGVAGRLYGEPKLSNFLTWRPLFGLIADDLPSWGGLEFAELSRMINQFKPPEKGLQDDDLVVWLDELAELLQTAKDAGTDCVTLYV
jgi:hypothetical protein